VLRAGSGISGSTQAKNAAEEACAEALAQLGGAAQAAILFATPHYGDSLSELLDAATACLDCEALVGASAHGVLGRGQEIESRASVAVLAISGLDALPFLLPDLEGAEDVAGPEIAAQIATNWGGPPRAEDLVVLLPDPRILHTGPLLAGVREALEPACIVGAGAADALAFPSRQWCGGKLETGALAGIVLRSQRAARIGVTQACQPVTELMTVTRCTGHWISELDGKPALDVYREKARGPLADDLQRAAASLLVALPSEGEDLRPGGYRVRNVAGFATGPRAFAIPHEVSPGDRIALALREPETAREDLKAVLAGMGTGSPGLGLYFDCCARGSGFFGVPGLEAAYLEQAFGSTPLVGMFGSCEIGPVGAGTELLTYTGVLALLDQS
jgi:small ligand-binding sensory domain FIST